jgi:PKD domain
VRRWAIATAVVVSMLAAGKPVPAAARWFSPSQPFDASQVEGSSATMAADGTVAVARAIQSGGITVRIRPPGGSFGPAVSLIPGGGEAPRLVAGPSGQIAAVWRVGWDEYAALRPPGGEFGAAHLIGFGSDEGPQQVAVDGSGRVWVADNGYNPARVLTLGADGSTNAFELGVGSGWQVGGASLGVDADGRAIVVYTQSRSQWGPADGDPCTSQSQIRVAEGGPAEVTDVGLLAEAAETGLYHLGSCTDVTGTDMRAASVAVHPSGEAVSTYLLGTVHDSGPVQWQALARVRPAGGAWPAAGTPAEPIGSSQAWPTPGFAGKTPIAMLEDAGAQAISLSARGPGGWSAPLPVAPGGGSSPLLATSSSGAATIVYATSSQVMGVVRATDGTLSSPVPLSGPLTDLPRMSGLAMDDSGDAVAVWNEGPWYEPHVVVAGYDGAGPQLGALPGRGEARQPMSFSAQAVDVWTGVAGVTWAFGDGAGASGDAVTHAFDSPGTFPVSVTAVDGVGNASTRSTSVTIVDTTPPTFDLVPKLIPKRPRRGKTVIVFFGVSEPATVRAQLLASRRGVRSGGRCVAPRRRRRRHARRCTRTVRLATRATRLEDGGVGNMAIATKDLRAGRYAVVIGATDPSGNRAQPVTLPLTVLPRRR